MCGLIFHKDPSTGLHTLIALVSPLKIQRKYHMPWIGFMNGMSHYYLGGGGCSDYYIAYLDDIICDMEHITNFVQLIICKGCTILHFKAI